MTIQDLKKLMKHAAREELDAVPVPPLGFKRLRPENDNPLPTYQTPGAAGMDIQACLPEREINCEAHSGLPSWMCGEKCENPKRKTRHLLLEPHSKMAVPTGFALKIPVGYDIEVRSRSGLALKDGIFVLNSPGTVDEDYTGEVKVILFNTTQDTFKIEHGMRIAQLVIRPTIRAAIYEEKNDLPVTVRGEGGFGSTGI